MIPIESVRFLRAVMINDKGQPWHDTHEVLSTKLWPGLKLYFDPETQTVLALDEDRLVGFAPVSNVVGMTPAPLVLPKGGACLHDFVRPEPAQPVEPPRVIETKPPVSNVAGELKHQIQHQQSKAKGT